MRILILGAGPAGISVAEHLRALQPATDHRPEITMISAESFPPYSPPAMADHFLNGRGAALYWKGTDICERLHVDYRAGTAVRQVDPTAKRVVLADDSALAYDELVIATGSRLYAPVDDYDLPGVYNFKSLTAAQELVAHARGGEVRSAVIVGAGFIGVEVALLLADLGLDVLMIEQQDRVMPGMLDAETAEIVGRALAERGVRVRVRTQAAAFAGNGRAEALVLEPGEVVKGDAYVAATGVKPNLDFLAGAGLETGWGLRVDDTLCTSAPNIRAAGDAVETCDRMTGERFVHAIFPNAVAQARVVAEQLLGYDTRYEGAESMNSLRHLGIPVIAVGRQTGETELKIRTDTQLRKINLTDGRIVGFRLAGDIRGAGVYRSLMLRRVDVSRYGDELLEPGFGPTRLAGAVFSQAA